LERLITIYSGLKEALISEAMPVSGLPLYPAGPVQSRDHDFWSRPVIRLAVPVMPPAAINLNMHGRKTTGPVWGFGQLWQKKYRLTLTKAGLTPESVITTLKDNFPMFQPAYNHFYPSTTGIRPGAVVAIDSSTPGGPVSTGVMVMYSDPISFTFITPQGHPESGWVDFSASRVGDKTIVQILGLARANDPVYEVAFRAIGSQMQIRIWTHVLTSLAVFLGETAVPSLEARLVDPSLDWSQTGNLWYNAQIRTIVDTPRRWWHRQGAAGRTGKG
jgi:hypothetical protein